MRWRWHRLRVMSPAELGLRCWRRLRRGAVHRAIAREHVPVSLSAVLAHADRSIGALTAGAVAPPLTPAYQAHILEAAEHVCAGHCTVMGSEYCFLDGMDWYTDPRRGVTYPRVPAWQINYRTGAQPDAIMPVWWLNRHQHLMPVAVAYFVTGEERYAQTIAQQLEHWLGACEYPYGPAWCTGIEAGVRVLTWSWLFRLLFSHGRPATFTDALLLAWFRAVRQHVRFIDAHWARYSSTNNHTIAEAVGVLAAACTWPALLPEQHWLRRARAHLRHACARQIAADGVDQEQSLSYHAFVLELLVNAWLADESLQRELQPLLQCMAAFVRACLAGTAAPVEFGDSDEAVATGILTRAPAYYAQVATAAEAVREPGAVGSFAPAASDVFWYVGDATPAGAAHATDNFQRGGYVLWRGAVDTGITAKLLVDVGPLGLGTLAAHGHADALAFALHINGEPVFVDCGTYAYHGEPAWRAYFRSTRAHNTLRLNDRDQARMCGPFLWRQHYRVRLHHAVASADQFDLAAEHDGYLASCGVIHRRHIAWHPLQRCWAIEDVLLGGKAVDVEWLLHVHPEREVQCDGASVTIRGTGYCVQVQCPAGLTVRVARGEVAPPLGWYSPRFGVKEPCATICASGRVEPATPMTTLLTITPAGT
jgi:hypothetical protein